MAGTSGVRTASSPEVTVRSWAPLRVETPTMAARLAVTNPATALRDGLQLVFGAGAGLSPAGTTGVSIRTGLRVRGSQRRWRAG